MGIVTEDRLEAAGIRTTLAEGSREFCVVAETGPGEEAHLVRHTPVDVLIACRSTARAALSALVDNDSDAARVHPSVLVLLTRATADDARRLLAFGAAGVLRRGTAAEHLPWAVHAAAHGSLALHPDLAAAVVAAYTRPVRAGRRQAVARRKMAALSRREREVLGVAAQGLGTQDIARCLGVTQTTVKAHLRSMYAKLGVTGRLQAARIAWEADRGPAEGVGDLVVPGPDERGRGGTGADGRADQGHPVATRFQTG